MDSTTESTVLNTDDNSAMNDAMNSAKNGDEFTRRADARRALRNLAPYVLGGLGLLLCGAAIPLFSYWRHKDAPVPAPKPLETVTATVGAVAQTVNASGKLTLYHYVDVGSQLAGQVKDVYVPVGETVKAGRLLLEIVPPPDTARVESTRAQLARLHADLTDQNAQYDFAQLQFQRQTRLMADHATREESLESSRTAMLSSSAKLDAIRAQIQQVEANMKNDEEMRKQSHITAPMSGTVVSLSAHQGQMLSAGQTTLLRIADLSRMTVQARVAEFDVTKLRKGMAAMFSTPGLPGKHWYGKLSQIMPLPIDDSAQQGKPSFYTVLFDVANPDRELMSGMNANVEFVITQTDNAVTIPSCLLLADPELIQPTLDVLDANGAVHARKVVIGLRNQRQTQVIAGLQAGEHIAVTHSDVADCLHAEKTTGKMVQKAIEKAADKGAAMGTDLEAGARADAGAEHS
jgi:macrolide-specific efflux system membrane fusion protein